MTADGKRVASTSMATMAAAESATVWYGTGADGAKLWDGRIDELALFDRALHPEDVASLYQVAQETVANSK